MKINDLAWDSIFFNKKIARVDVDVSDSKQEVFVYLKEQSSLYDLLYVFCPENFVITDEKCKKVDEKVIYTGIVDEQNIVYANISLYNKKIVDKELFNLAIISGEYSRFKIDNNFDYNDFIKLYYKWIEESVNGNMADFILCYHEGNLICGMVTVKINKDSATIGLIAVDEIHQNFGIGSKLISATKYELNKIGVKTINVATQKNNYYACSFYEKQGMKVTSVTNIYHYWSNK